MDKRIEIRNIGNQDFRSGEQLKIAGATFAVCVKGSAHVVVNGAAFTLKAGAVAFMAFDMSVVCRGVSDDFAGAALFADFDTTQNIFYRIGNSGFWEIIYTRPVFIPRRDEFRQLLRWMRLSAWTEANVSPDLAQRCLAQSAADMLAVVAERVVLLRRGSSEMPKKNRAWTLTNDFVGLLERHCPSHHDVAYFARKLNITPNYLNIIVKKNLGVSAKTQILIKIIEVAKVLLSTTDLNVKQISEILNFEDPSYLARVFRKRTGLTPLQYRNSLTAEAL